jgi:uncharacterized protein (TIGR04255 family)
MSREIIQYKRTYLTQVIIRLDFAAQMQSFVNGLPRELARAALTRFPLSEPKEVVLSELQIPLKDESTAVQRHDTKMKHWFYHGRDRQKTLCIMPDAMFIEHKVSVSFAPTRDEFLEIANTLFSSAPEVQIRRFGLRYVNQIDLPNGQPTDWSGYIHDYLLLVSE